MSGIFLLRHYFYPLTNPAAKPAETLDTNGIPTCGYLQV
jgi:hypothetical protein